MTPKQFQAAIDRLGLSQVGAARLVGADPRTARKWAAGNNKVPECVAILLRLLIAGKITTGDIDAARQ
jgi:DNA-binding transcriptional regulator YiaG